MFLLSFVSALHLAVAATSSAGMDQGSASRRATQNAAPIYEDFECNCGQVHRKLLSSPLVETVPGEGVNGGNAIRVTYAGDNRGSAHISRSFPLPARGLEYTLNYDVKFDQDFQFVKGGKLHGLAPDRPVNGGKAGGANNWSARVMWRGNGKLGTYTYHQSQRGRYGDRGRVASPFAFQKGNYYSVALHVRLNSPASEANGFTRLYVNGKLIEADEGIQFRAVEGPQTLISKFSFTTFHGGHDPTWAPKTSDGRFANVHAYFDNFAVYPGARIRQRPGQ